MPRFARSLRAWHKSPQDLRHWQESAIAFPVAYIQSFDTLVQTNDWLRQKLQLLRQKNNDELSSQAVRQQLDQLGEFQLDKNLAQQALTYFPESKLGQALYICVAIAVCVPIASMVMMHPAKSSNSNNAGIAVISLDLSATLTCPKTRRCSLAHALTRR